ncbi:hypothetical protein FKN04_22580 [Bacillus glycinifermentans]|uniref:hypothetical protein n=1 Tax=Bacillus glycinifermentans TaxID=1664069 RepID=UPI001582F8E3|nr:hypothetical protein [Bacillus glycinifermentans]NUJ19322.1 hypothetical protein [Bacillus glycinifermentans]
MSRLHTMARFDERVPAPDFVGTCEGCGELILKGEEHFDNEGDLIHNDSSCMTEYLKQIANYIQ